jgi:Holliday junction resolvase RusA-like endonuclease
MRTLSFFVPGVPRPQGSKRAFSNPRTGKPILVESSKGNASWRVDVAYAARLACGKDWAQFIGPVIATFTFWFARPKSHRRADSGLKPSAPRRHVSKPDLSKLVRSVEDALSGIVYHDDSQIYTLCAYKEYREFGGTPGVTIRIEGDA